MGYEGIGMRIHSLYIQSLFGLVWLHNAKYGIRVCLRIITSTTSGQILILYVLGSTLKESGE